MTDKKHPKIRIVTFNENTLSENKGVQVSNCDPVTCNCDPHCHCDGDCPTFNCRPQIMPNDKNRTFFKISKKEKPGVATIKVEQ